MNDSKALIDLTLAQIQCYEHDKSLRFEYWFTEFLEGR